MCHTNATAIFSWSVILLLISVAAFIVAACIVNMDSFSGIQQRADRAAPGMTAGMNSGT
ncbi:MAG: hypothetical protein RIA08_16175 [Roseovarius sp.]|uniref:hypothetical protein n=1 Tax=Roseovarius sp. TaxID=1486281 RepID=UPI0032EDC4C3